MRVFNTVLAAFTIAATLVATLIFFFSASSTDAASELKSTSDSTYQVIFHLKRATSEAAIDKLFWDISTPGTDKFRQFLTYPQLQELVGAPRSVISRARHFLEHEAGCVKVEQLNTNDALVCTLSKKDSKSLKTAVAVEEAFEIENEKQKGIFRIDVTERMPLSIRKLLRSAIAYRKVDKTSKPVSGRDRYAKKNLGQPGMTQTPLTINKRYKVPHSSTFPPLAPSVIGCVGEFEGEYFQESDIQTFAEKYNLNRLRIEISGGNTNSGDADAIEGTLDISHMASIYNNTIPLLWAEGGSSSEPGGIDFSRWIDKLMARRQPPAVISISYGLGVYNYYFSQSVLFADNDAFRKAGLIGISVMAASGDSGVGTRSEILQCTQFVPSWPASSSYLTSVGALYANSESEQEIALDWTGSGFSTTFVRPPYQDIAVTTYLQNTPNLPNASYYNASGRAYPDVTAVGSNFNEFVGGSWQLVSGTSAASPTFAGIITLIVAERVAKNQTLLGFLNPKLYNLGKVGQDITQGQNQDDNCIPFFPIPGFPATQGWDAVTGFGSPDYEFLRQNL